MRWSGDRAVAAGYVSPWANVLPHILPEAEPRQAAPRLQPFDVLLRTRSLLAYILSVPRIYGCTRHKNKKSKIYASSRFYDSTEDGRPLALAGIFFAFTFGKSSGAVPG